MSYRRKTIKSPGPSQQCKDTEVLKKIRSEGSTKPQCVRRAAGGAGTAGGIDFQAAVTAYASVFMARGRPLLWLKGIVDDIPTAIEAETGGAGDDLRLLLKEAQSVEVQAKQGLRSGSYLWETLTKLAEAVITGTANFGVLVVSNSSSKTITVHLARDIERIGDGCTDNFSAQGEEFLQKLKALHIPSRDACERIRIVTIAAMNTEQEAIVAVRAQLEHLCADETQIGAAWDALYHDAVRLINMQGRRDISSFLRVLRSSNITLADTKTTTPALLLAKLARWTSNTNATFSIFGVRTPLKTDEAWIPLAAIVRQEQSSKSSSLAEELQRYQTWEDRSISRDAHSVAPETLGRFVHHAIVVAGPGMGKTTLLKRIALRYSEDAFPVLYVKLSAVAARMRTGASFEESVFHLGLDGSGISVADAQLAKLPNWLLLCDGLDESGLLQEDVATGISRFTAGHPDCRILVTTRPVGYHATHFTEWRHYELPALDTWEAHAHAARLVESIAPPGSDLHNNAWDICRRELDDSAAAKVIGRTPLMLGLAVAIIVRGKRLGATRERLFEQIFELIDEIPNARIPEKPATAMLLQRFLDILGWEITCHSLRSIKETIEHCANHLARETGAGPLAAVGDAERYLGYWQDIGMIERVGQDDQQTLAFIHKSFGEFTAARRLHPLPQDAQAAAVVEIASIPARAEVLRFAGMMGLADLITDHLLTSSTIDIDTVKRVSMAVELIAEADPPPNPLRRSRILEEAFKVASSARRMRAFEVGLSLVAATRRFPDEVSPAASVHVGSEHPWMRLIAWSCLVAAGPKHYSINDLIAVLRSNADAVGPGSQPSLGGGLILTHGAGHELAETFILDACAIIIDRAPPEIADDVVPEVLNHPNLSSMGFVSKARDLIEYKGKNYRVEKLEQPEPSPSLFEMPDGYFEANRARYEAIFDALDLPDPLPHDDRTCPHLLLHLSAFIEASQINKVPDSDVWVWSQPSDSAVVRATLQAFIAISGIDLEMLRQDAVYAKRLLDSDDKARRSLFDVTVHVDPLPVDWSRAKALSLDAAMIEEAISHPSQWIKWIAANLLEKILEANELERAIRRLFKTGRGLTLWAACGLAFELDRQHALLLILERLAKPIVRGCGYLFDLLSEGVRPQTNLLLAPINSGLLASDVDTALAAAKLATVVATPRLDSLVPILEEAYAHWVVNEEPYPTKGGRIPDSPRANLIEALVKIRPRSYEDIRSLLRDSRHDVREIGVKVLMERLNLPDGERLQFFREVEAGDLPAQLLGKALMGGLPLGEEEIATVEHLLVNPSKHLRFEAMALLSEHYLAPDRILAHADAMTRDSEQQIKERAFSLLEKAESL